jgi:ribonuclease HI
MRPAGRERQLMGRRRKKVYAVARGRKPGVYEVWSGNEGAQAQVDGFRDALYKGFYSMDAALGWLRDQGIHVPAKVARTSQNDGQTAISSQGTRNAPEVTEVVIYTDGGSIDNPGPGGYGVVLLSGGHRKELSGGFRLTTNNRMELMACIVGLGALRTRSNVKIYSDSSYVVNACTKGWARKWRAKGWKRTKRDYAENADLWARLLDLCDQHEVAFVWVRGHAGNRENERADRLATRAARRAHLPADAAYERGETQHLPPKLFEL